MKILALRGPDSCGKTSTLNLVYTDLIDAGAISTNREQLGGNPNDFSDILEFMGRRIAFFTMGDFARETINAIHFYANLEVDFLILATNSKFSTPLNLIRNFPHNIVNKTIANPKTRENNFEVNTRDKEIILSFLQF
jgi:hypothetical protein